MAEDETAAASADDEEVEQEMERVEEDPPKSLDDWPGGKAKYKTFGGAEAESGYGEGITEKLGPSDVQHHDDGSVTVEGEEVDDPDEYKGEPIPGGPTDPDAPPDPGFDKDAAANQGDDDGDEADDEDDDEPVPAESTPRSRAGRPLRPGEPAPWDPDTT